MSPEQLKAYLDVLRAANLMSAHVKLATVDGPLEFAVVFGPEPGVVQLGVPVELAPGAWKGPEKLDQHFEVEELPQLSEQPYHTPVDPEHPEQP